MSYSGGRAQTPSGVASARSLLANPAAGADWVTAPGPGKTLLVVHARLTTSATVANRTPQLQITDGGGNVVWQSTLAPADPAGGSTDYFWFNGAPVSAATGITVTNTLPVVPLGAGWTVGTNTPGIQVGDQWSALVLTTAG